MYLPFIFICIVPSLTILIFLTYVFLQIQYILLVISFSRALIYYIKFLLPFLQETFFPPALIEMTTLKSIAYLFHRNIPSVYCCIRAPVPWIPRHSLSQLIPRFDWSCSGCGRSPGVQLLGVHQTFIWHLLSHLQPPNTLRPLGELARFLLVSPLLCSSPFKEVWNPLCTEDSLSTEVLFVLKSLYCLCPFRSLEKGLWRKNGGKREERVFGGELEPFFSDLFIFQLCWVFAVVQASPWCGSSCYRAWASAVRACRLSSCSLGSGVQFSRCGTQALLLLNTWTLPRPGVNPCPLHCR